MLLWQSEASSETTFSRLYLHILVHSQLRNMTKLDKVHPINVAQTFIAQSLSYCAPHREAATKTYNLLV